jgi:hypothetical protein
MFRGNGKAGIVEQNKDSKKSETKDMKNSADYIKTIKEALKHPSLITIADLSEIPSPTRNDQNIKYDAFINGNEYVFFSNGRYKDINQSKDSKKEIM